LTEEETSGVNSADNGVPEATDTVQANDERQEEVKDAQHAQRKDAEYNWSEARRKMQDLERRAQEQQELIERLSHKPAPQEDDELSKLSEDDILTVAQARKLATKMARQVAHEAIKEREAATVEERLNIKFPDYNQIVNRESIELLKQQEPELAQSIIRLADDPLQQATAAYKLIKKLGIKQDATPSPDIKKARENALKPVSIQTVNKQSAIGQAYTFENGLTNEVKKALREEMESCARRA
jgi:hypothetical protein